MAISVSLSNNGSYYPRIGGGHHYIKMWVTVTGKGVGNNLLLFINGGLFGSCTEYFNLNLQHTCGGSGYVIKIEERDGGGALVSDFTTPPEVLCSSEDLFMVQDPITLSCNITAGTNKDVLIQSIPAIAGFTVRLYLDGDDTYAILDSAITDGLGQATLTIPNAVNGEKYRFTTLGNGYRESFGSNYVEIGAGCQNFVINPTLTCEETTPIVSFNPLGGSGNYSYSFNNNDATGYFPYTSGTPIALTNATTYTIHIKDNVTLNKIVYAIVTNCTAPPVPVPVVPTPVVVPVPVPVVPTPVVVPVPVVPSPIPLRTIYWEYIFSGENCEDLGEFFNYQINNIYTNGVGFVVGNLAYLDISLTTLLPSGIFKKTDNSLTIEVLNGQIISIL